MKLNGKALAAAIFLLIASAAYAQEDTKTTFQTSRAWSPTIDNRADAVMVYGVAGNPSDRDGRSEFESRVLSWRDRGYRVHFMTGIAWGSYQDYFTGKWDGRMHLDEGQVTEKGDTIWHGHMVPYIVPSENYLKYMKEAHVRRVIDTGITDIFMEEPEFWARGGYSEAFKREWQEYYGSPWRAQKDSPEATYLSNKLKYHLYYRALNEVFTYAKEYGRSKGLEVRCYVPTHSLLNYSQWAIVSPEASLASLPCVDGYIAQVWTGTSREPSFYRGQKKERVFETAYLEYGSMESMTAPTGRKMFFLTDPIEDRARDWDDYKRNYQATFTAQLLYPQIADYEVMPWPERIYEGLYRVSAHSERRAHIPDFYATQMQVMINSLNRMPLSGNVVSGTQGFSVLMGNSLMFQRFPTHQGYDDPQLSNFMGEALPLLKLGIPVKTVHLENLQFPQALAGTKVLLMSYSNMKPLDPSAHEALADWVRKGGIIVYSGRDDDPFQTVSEWWNKAPMAFNAPSDHLFSLLGIPEGAEEGEYSCGSGKVWILRHDPKEYVLRKGGEKVLVETAVKAYGAPVEQKNSLMLQRGPYTVCAVLDESVSDKPLTIKGRFIDLYDCTLPVLKQKTLQPGEQCLLLDMSKVEDRGPRVVASASRESDEVVEGRSYSYVAKSPIRTKNVSRVLLPGRPRKVTVDGSDVFNPSDWDSRTSTYLLRYDNSPEGVKVHFEW